MRIADIAANAVLRSFAATAAMGSPTNRTMPSSPSSETAALTPAIARAGARSRSPMRPCAIGERRMMPSSCPS
jgi:hypothetical protein